MLQQDARRPHLGTGFGGRPACDSQSGHLRPKAGTRRQEGVRYGFNPTVTRSAGEQWITLHSSSVLPNRYAVQRCNAATSKRHSNSVMASISHQSSSHQRHRTHSSPGYRSFRFHHQGSNSKGGRMHHPAHNKGDACSHSHPKPAHHAHRHNRHYRHHSSHGLRNRRWHQEEEVN